MAPSVVLPSCQCPGQCPTFTKRSSVEIPEAGNLKFIFDALLGFKRVRVSITMPPASERFLVGGAGGEKERSRHLRLRRCKWDVHGSRAGDI